MQTVYVTLLDPEAGQGTYEWFREYAAAAYWARTHPDAVLGTVRWQIPDDLAGDEVVRAVLDDSVPQIEAALLPAVA